MAATAKNNLLLAWSTEECAQVAAVKAWTGEITPSGVMPVRMPRVSVRRFEF